MSPWRPFPNEYDAGLEIATVVPYMATMESETANEALFEAIKAGDADKIRSLLDDGADPNASNKDRERPLHAALNAAKSGLLCRRLPTTGLDEIQMAITHDAGAAREACLEMLRVLLSRGADRNAPDENGNTPLHAAAEQGFPDAVRLLLKEGAARGLRNANEKTTRDLAHGREAGLADCGRRTHRSGHLVSPA